MPNGFLVRIPGEPHRAGIDEHHRMVSSSDISNRYRGIHGIDRGGELRIGLGE